MNATTKTEASAVVLDATNTHQAPALRTPSAVQAAASPDNLLAIAVERGVSLDYLERLLALKERHDATEARKAFVQAMTEFKREPLDIFKSKSVGYTTKDGDFVGYKHAQLSDVAEVVVPAMARYGLSHRWDVAQESGRIRVRCIVTHERGHSETVELDGAPDNSGKKNAIQQVASTVTYLQRYTLLLATGLATKDQQDDDGKASGDADSDGDDISELLAELYEIKDDARALQFWQQKREALRGSQRAYERFKNVVAEYRRALQGAAK